MTDTRARYGYPPFDTPKRVADGLWIVDAAVFWLTADDPLFRLVGDFPFPSSDHRLTWIDVAVPGGPDR